MNALERSASLTVADRARDAGELRMLLDMLGLLHGQATPYSLLELPLPSPAPSPKRTRRQNTAPAVKRAPVARGGHGTFSEYTKGCRCDECRAANTGNRGRQRAKAKADPALADRAGHGKANTYRNYGCRCDLCRAAIREERRASGNKSKADRAGHGSANTYRNHNCRCDLCKAAYGRYRNEYNARRRAALREAS